jgi:hypothetical protein
MKKKTEHPEIGDQQYSVGFNRHGFDTDKFVLMVSLKNQSGDANIYLDMSEEQVVGLIKVLQDKLAEDVTGDH